MLPQKGGGGNNTQGWVTSLVSYNSCVSMLTTKMVTIRKHVAVNTLLSMAWQHMQCRVLQWVDATGEPNKHDNS